jgi:hypothetical protein
MYGTSYAWSYVCKTVDTDLPCAACAARCPLMNLML